MTSQTRSTDRIMEVAVENTVRQLVLEARTIKLNPGMTAAQHRVVINDIMSVARAPVVAEIIRRAAAEEPAEAEA